MLANTVALNLEMSPKVDAPVEKIQNYPKTNFWKSFFKPKMRKPGQIFSDNFLRYAEEHKVSLMQIRENLTRFCILGLKKAFPEIRLPYKCR